MNIVSIGKEHLMLSKSITVWSILLTVAVLSACTVKSNSAGFEDPVSSPLTQTEASPTVAPATPTAASIIAQGEDVSFEMCGSGPSWARPSEEEQISIWESSRYAGADEEILKYPWTHDFLVTYGSASIQQDLIDLGGLWSLPEGARAGCIEPERHQALINWEEVELWILLHRVKKVRRIDTSYAIVVEPAEAGAQFVRLPRPDQVPLSFIFVTEEEEVVDKIVEEDYRYWPGG